MGLLDDAIRDHLELKRRHGADAGEVARQEQEALGPARREPPEASDDAAAYDAGDEFEDEYAPGPGDEVEETTDEEPLYDEDLVGEDDGEDESPADPDVAAAAPAGAASADLADIEQPTAGYELEELRRAQRPDEEDAARAGAEDVVPADEEPDADDVLEETPEFLQETPEHDRLWFEQKPPKDFDF